MARLVSKVKVFEIPHVRMSVKPSRDVAGGSRTISPRTISPRTISPRTISPRGLSWGDIVWGDIVRGDIVLIPSPVQGMDI